jgi:hypothetical protein
LRKAPFTLKVTAICDTGNHKCGHVDAACFPTLPNLRRFFLPPHRPVHKNGHSRVFEAHEHSLLEKTFNTLV